MAATREIIRLVHEDTGHFYMTTVAKGTKGFTIKKFNPVLRKHVMYKQKSKK